MKSNIIINKSELIEKRLKIIKYQIEKIEEDILKIKKIRRNKMSIDNELFYKRRLALSILLELKKEERYNVYICDNEGGKYYLDDAIDRLRNVILSETLDADGLRKGGERIVIEKIKKRGKNAKD